MSKFVTYPAVTVLDDDQSLLIDSPSAGTNSITAENAGNTLLSKWAGFDTFDEAVQNTIENNQEFIDRDTAIREETAELKKKIVTTFPAKEASGDVATFESEFEDAPLKSCIVQVEPVQAGSGDPSPDNVRPITGWTEAKVTRTGFNVWDEEWEVGDLSYSGQPITASDRIRTKNFIHVIPNTAYYFKTGVSGQTSWQLFGCYYDKDKNFISTFYRRNSSLTTPSNCHYIKWTTTGGYGATYNHDISINYPSTDHDYHPYTGQTYPITFPSEAGTVYGAHIDVINGELVVDRASEEFLFVNPDTNNGLDSKIFTLANTSTSTTSKDGKITNVVNEYVYAGASYEKPHFYLGRTGFVIYLKENTYRGGTVQVCYPLAEPIHYPITSHEVKSLLGQNNIWADTGDTSVEYLMSDVGWYVEKKLRAFQSILAGVEDSAVASKNYSTNSYLIFNDDIYRVTKTITAGETIEDGVNVTKTTVAEQLMALAQV